jgi:chemotaxis protein MotB
MRISSVTLRWIGFATLATLVGGCVSQDQYNALKLDRDRMAEQLVSAQRDASQAKSAADAYKNQIDNLAATGPAKDALVLNLTQDNANLKAQNDDLNRRYQELLARPATAGNALPPPLTNALTAFAQQNPDLVDFDSARGIVKFKSDVVFNVGDATLTPKAREVIDRFAAILNSAAASQYELLVAGHTDNQPVHNPATISAGHKDNWYLSAHRAISVSNELQRTGVSSAQHRARRRGQPLARRPEEGRDQDGPESLEQGHRQRAQWASLQQVRTCGHPCLVCTGTRADCRVRRSNGFDGLSPSPRLPRRGPTRAGQFCFSARSTGASCL